MTQRCKDVGRRASRIACDRYVRNRRGGVPPPDGLGDPTPRDSTARFPLYPCNPSIPGEASGLRQPPHCTPLECCSWANRPSIDITLRWSEKQSRFPVFCFSGFPIFNPANPLILNILIQTTPTLHSAGVLFLGQSPFYRHYAPLERKAIPFPRFLFFWFSRLESCESFNPEHPDSDNLHIALRWSAVLGPIALL